MTYRSYPNADRARHQIGRHDGETPPLSEPRPMTLLERNLVEYATAVVQAAAPVVASMAAGFQRRPVSSEETTT
jgi:hypothetical protein